MARLPQMVLLADGYSGVILLPEGLGPTSVRFPSESLLGNRQPDTPPRPAGNRLPHHCNHEIGHEVVQGYQAGLSNLEGCIQGVNWQSCECDMEEITKQERHPDRVGNAINIREFKFMRIRTISLLLACLWAFSCRNAQGIGASCQQESDTLACLIMADSLLEPLVNQEEIEAFSIFYGDVEGGQYIEVSNSGVSFSGIDSFFLFDITGDKIPEIWLLTDDCEASRLLLVYSVSDGNKELFRSSATHSSYYLGEGYVLQVSAHMGEAEWFRLRWNGKRIVSQRVYRESTRDQYRVPEEKPAHILLPNGISPDELQKIVLDIWI